ncbi:roadblock/LC7 domain-containing protein [Actinacidiphila sp. ITFR-21]|uniref:roadblock/LC7 domain-containing protein n=1 Tax=Actinacidiphila sp. ITFR-21 TaxID=3075199 RepID=UPI00288C4A1E|nr:roadblock/LC7 domain-containing protein [Streptomyces sp. ITFR-21]WNI19961.1 roadblock/LC7 domain-containing protein [Streptomyces sp. ITFR-21]
MSGTTPVPAPAPDLSDLNFLLDRFLTTVPNARVAQLATTDGLSRACAGTDRSNAERLAAVAAALHSLGLGVGRALDRGQDSRLRQAFIETDTDRVFVMLAAAGTLLTVIADLDADPNLTGHEMAVLVNSVQAHLVTPGRGEL